MKCPAALTMSLICAFPLLGPQKTSGPVKPDSGQACAMSPDSAEIYSRAIKETLLKDDDGETIVLFAETSAGYPPGMAASTSFDREHTKELMDAANATTRSDFNAKRGVHCYLPTNIEPLGRVVFLTEKQEERLFRRGIESWKTFEKKYPHAGGFTLVSSIGFNSSHDQALVYVGNSCGLTCGSGYFVLLEKKDGKWQVTKTANFWVS
jgi:hypothetical protein